MPPQQQSHHKLFIASILLFVAALLFVAGVLYWVRYGGEKPPSAANAQELAALPRVQKEKDVVGTVVSVSADSLVVKQGATNTAVAVDSKTQIYKAGQKKDPAVYQKELTQFNATVKSASPSDGTYFAPDPYVDMPLALADLKSGDLVFISADEAGGSLIAARILVGLPPATNQ